MGEEVGRERADGEEREVKKLGDPRKPTQEEVVLHERTHLPYRNWCYHCVPGKGKDLDHRKSAEEERGLSEYSFDYCFPGDEFGFKLTILVGRERATSPPPAPQRSKGERAKEWSECCDSISRPRVSCVYLAAPAGIKASQ